MFDGFYSIINSLFQHDPAPSQLLQDAMKRLAVPSMYTETTTTIRNPTARPITAGQAASIAGQKEARDPEYTGLVRSIDKLIMSMAVKGEKMVNVTIPPHLHKYHQHFIGEYTARQFRVSYRHNKGATECMLRISWHADGLAAGL